MKSRARFIFYFAAILSLSLSVSCVPLKKLKYLQDESKDTIVNSFETERYNYRLQSGDYLYIRINSLDEKTNTLFGSIISGSGISGNYSFNDNNLYLTSYIINDSGFISFPVIGKIQAAGYTVNEVQDKIFKVINQYVVDASVIVRQVNFLVTLLGEVRTPGQLMVYKEKISILEAIALKGDLTTFADRKHVRIVRHKRDKTDIITLDITRKDLLKSGYYYLKPNDLVYIDPLKSKQFAFETFPYGMAFSTISFVLALYTLLR